MKNQIIIVCLVLFSYLGTSVNAQTLLTCSGSKTGAKVSFVSKSGQDIKLKIDWKEGSHFHPQNLTFTNATCTDCKPLGGQKGDSRIWTIRQQDASKPVTVAWAAPGASRYCGGTTAVTVPETTTNKTLELDGKSHISTTNPNFYKDNFTVEGWFKAIPNVKEGTIVSVYNSSNNGAAITIQIHTDGKLRGTMRTKPSHTGGINVFSKAKVNDGKWHHFALVRKSDNKIHMYIDGKLDMSSSGTQSDIGSKTYTLDIGRNIPATSADRHFIGELDEVRLWDKTRSDSEISASFNKQPLSNPTAESNLILYYDFDAISGTNVPDESSNSNKGIIKK